MRSSHSCRPRCVRGGVAATMVLWCGVSLSAADWPQWLGPQRNGVSTETVAPWKDKPTVVWRQAVGSGFAVPVVADGRLFVHAAVPEKDAEEVIAFDAATGVEAWRDSYTRAPYRSELGNGPRGTPTVADGKLYTFGITGVLSCYDCASGRRLWQANPYDELKASLPGFGVCCSPVVAEGRVIVLVGGEGIAVVAYDAETGQVAWQGLDEPAGSASPIVIQRGEGENRRSEVVVQTTLRLAGVDAKDGAVRWEHPLVFQPNGVSPTPLLLGNLLICSTQDTGTLTLDLPVSSISQPEVKWWNQDLSSYFSTGTIDAKGRVFLVTNALMPLPNASIRCVQAADGTELWQRDSLGYFHVGLIATADGKLLLLDDSGKLVLGEPTATGFEILSSTKVCGGTFCNPVLANGLVYVRDKAGVTCLNLSGDAQATPAGE